MPYTANAPAATTADVIRLRIRGPFAPRDHAEILRAIGEWNVALNGFVRFDIAAGGRTAGSWVVLALHGDPPVSRSTLAFTYALPTAGGLVAIYIDRIGRRHLRGVMMHELGHVLGLGHVWPSGLMAARYHPASQHCIDRSAIQAVATRRRLPVERLNWCESGLTAAR